ncbi:hypothetical protein [Hallella seregens]|uniref:Uncharacterized protein n=1 Tax=Hallella seregens ATCC 51272 TaxID=1336250 RepID=A0ABV5ZM46_9BACT|nr:hypothetical protein [Hallella seregens]
MKASNNCQRKTDVTNHRSYFDWDCNMQVIHKGNGDIAMTESELVKFFGVTWMKVNYRLQTLMKSPNLYPDERQAGEENIYANEQLRGYAPLYPFPIIIALSFQLDSTEAYLFRKHVCQSRRNMPVVRRYWQDQVQHPVHRFVRGKDRPTGQ